MSSEDAATQRRKAAILRGVQDQLESPDTPEVRLHYRRLLSLGHSDAEARELKRLPQMIGKRMTILEPDKTLERTAVGAFITPTSAPRVPRMWLAAAHGQVSASCFSPTVVAGVELSLSRRASATAHLRPFTNRTTPMMNGMKACEIS
jgi:hypothetical protein